jgi:hypothetical protein
LGACALSNPSAAGFSIDIPTIKPNSTLGDADGKQLPAGAVQGRTDFGTAGFGGACPPAGDKPHRYIFTVYALKTEKIDAPAASTAAMVGYMLNSNRLAKSSVTAYYGR